MASSFTDNVKEFVSKLDYDQRLWYMYIGITLIGALISIISHSPTPVILIACFGILGVMACDHCYECKNFIMSFAQSQQERPLTVHQKNTGCTACNGGGLKSIFTRHDSIGAPRISDIDTGAVKMFNGEPTKEEAASLPHWWKVHEEDVRTDPLDKRVNWPEIPYM